MDFYRIKLGDQNNREWRAILKKEEDEKHSVIRNLNAGKKLLLEQPINMELVNVYLREEQKEDNPFDLDLIYWKDDLTLDAFKPKGVSCVIVSQKFKELLEKYDFHDHAFYPLHLYHPDKCAYKKYFLLQIFDRWLQYVNYLKSEFTLKDVRTRKVVDQIVDNQSFDDLESYVSRKSMYLRNENLLLEFSKAILTVDYDVLWSIMNELIVNEVVKNDIENSEIKGVDISRLKSPEYVLKSEFEELG